MYSFRRSRLLGWSSRSRGAGRGCWSRGRGWHRCSFNLDSFGHHKFSTRLNLDHDNRFYGIPVFVEGDFPCDTGKVFGGGERVPNGLAVERVGTLDRVEHDARSIVSRSGQSIRDEVVARFVVVYELHHHRVSVVRRIVIAEITTVE